MDISLSWTNPEDSLLVRKNNPLYDIISDFHFYNFAFCKGQHFDEPQTSTFLSVMKRILDRDINDSFTAVTQSHDRFQHLVQKECVDRSPHSKKIFDMDQSAAIVQYVTDTYYRHYNLYQFNFTKRVTTILQQKELAETVVLPRPLNQAMVNGKDEHHYSKTSQMALALAHKAHTHHKAYAAVADKVVDAENEGKKGKKKGKDESDTPTKPLLGVVGLWSMGHKDSESEQASGGEQPVLEYEDSTEKALEDTGADSSDSDDGGDGGDGLKGGNRDKGRRGGNGRDNPRGSGIAAVRDKRAGQIKESNREWQWKWICSRELRWISYLPEVAAQIEKAYQMREQMPLESANAGTEVPIAVGGGVERFFDFRRMVMNNKQAKRCIDIRRVEDDTSGQRRAIMRQAKTVCAKTANLAFSASLGALQSANAAVEVAQVCYRRKVMFSAGIKWHLVLLKARKRIRARLMHRIQERVTELMHGNCPRVEVNLERGIVKMTENLGMVAPSYTHPGCMRHHRIYIMHACAIVYTSWMLVLVRF
jgi:hypothetical protein